MTFNLVCLLKSLDKITEILGYVRIKLPFFKSPFWTTFWETIKQLFPNHTKIYSLHFKNTTELPQHPAHHFIRRRKRNNIFVLNWVMQFSKQLKISEQKWAKSKNESSTRNKILYVGGSLTRISEAAFLSNHR